MKKLVDFGQISTHESPEESPGFLLWRVSTSWRRAIEEVLKTFDLTHPQFVVLATIGWLTKDDKKVSQADVARQAGLDPNTTSQIMRSLQTKQFIERSRSTDERSKYPTLTSTGAQTLIKALPAVEKADEMFFSVLNVKKSGLLDALQKLALTSK